MRATPRTALVLALATAAAVGCSQRVTPEDEFAERPAERPRAPLADAARSAPPAGADPATIRGRVDPPPGAEGAPIEGVLFVFVRPAGARGGPPLAVQRHPAPRLPLDFAIGPADAMIPGTGFPDRVDVEARLDRDGDPLTSGDDDWSGRLEGVDAGAEGVVVSLARPAG